MNKTLYSLAFVSLLAMGSCSSEDLTSPSEEIHGKEVHVTLTVDRSFGATRTEVGENDDKQTLYSHWVEGDEILVVKDTQQVGTLGIESIATDNPAKAVFSGIVNLNATDKYTLVYLGGKNANGDGAYAKWVEGSGINNPVATPDEEDGFSVSGDKADLCRADLMTKGDVQFLVSGDNAYPTEDVTLAPVKAMAHFTFTELPSNLANDATLTVNYGEVSHTISKIAQDLYLPMPAGEYAIKFTLKNGADTHTASILDGAEVKVNPGLYYTETDASGKGKGIGVELKKENDPNKVITNLPLDESELVGPVFEVNGKKFRFTKSNLKYNTKTQKWGLIGEQYDYLCKAGWEHSDGTWGKDKETEIDQFGFGTTGLYDAAKMVRAQSPAFWCTTGSAGQASETLYPTNNTEYNNGDTGGYLQNGIQFMDYDWGRAYYLCKNNEPESTDLKPFTTYDWARDSKFETSGKEAALRYFTLSSDDWGKIIDYYYVIGCTIIGVDNPVLTSNTDKDKIYGLMILPIKGDGSTSGLRTVSKRKKVTKWIKDKDVTAFTNADVSYTSNTAFKYESLRLTVEQFENFEELGAVFLPEAGYRDSTSQYNNTAHYWTSTAGQTKNATLFDFDGNSSTKVFKMNSISRAMGCAVRLVREVPANYNSPVVVE